MSEPTSAAAPAPADAVKPAPWAKQAGAAGTPWGKGQGRPAGSRATERLRRTIDGLPDWEPAPPGEVVIQRGRRQD